MTEVPRNALDRVGTEVSFTSRSSGTCRRSLLFIAPPGNISDSLLAAVEREFTWLTVLYAPEMKDACADSNSGTELILVDQQLLEDFLAHKHAVKRSCPQAATAILGGFRTPSSRSLLQVIEANAVCGVLPMDVNLDVWLSILRILLKGGEYFPPRLLQHQEKIEDEPRSRRSPADAAVHAETGSGAMNQLTERERQILERVARGNQNKIIAADLGLSEHTIKIHLHNIIQKLGVHNRTEAAAIYHANMRQPEERPTDDPSTQPGHQGSRRKGEEGGDA